MRLNRFLAAAGFGSRRSCEELISSGAVVINGHRIDKLATEVAEGDKVTVNGRPAKVAPSVHILLHKPRGYVVTRSDEKGRKTVFDLLPPDFGRLFHVGRLDRESEGLLILTNDGDLAQHLTHPSKGVEKEYEVTLDKPFVGEHAAKLLRGVYIEGGRGKFERLRVVAPTKLIVVLKQGIKRQIRLMFYDLGYEVERLVRTRIGPLKGRGLRAGAYRPLTKEEIVELREPAPVEKTPSARKPRAKDSLSRPREREHRSAAARHRSGGKRSARRSS